MTKKPSYRFEGYTEPWEQKKLGAYLTVSKNRNVDGKYDKSDVLSVSGDYGIVNQIKFQGRSFAGASVLLYGIVETGDVVYTKSPLKANPYGIIKTNHGKNGIVSTLYAIYKVNNGSNGIFVEYYFDDNLRLNKYLKPLVNKGAKNDMKVTDENVLKGDVIFPFFPEQTAIGSFFQDIDQLISLQQRKLEVLKEQKKTYLKLLFPAKGQTKPALRFAGFEDDWKEVKLGDLILIGGSGGTPKSTVAKYYGGDIPFLSITDISNSGKYLKKTEKTITNEGLQNSSAWVVPEGAISLAMYASVGKLAILGIDCATSQAFYNMVFEDDIVRNFVYITLEKANIYNEWGSLISTGTQANLNAEKVKNFSFLHPSKPEQEAIGSFFQDLDKAIAKQEEKVNQLKESKQTLLRKMFI